MKLYCAQLAWYHASFKTNPNDKGRSTKVARLFSMREKKEEIEFPPIRCAAYIMGYMQKIGFPMASEGYVKHSEIKCWCDTQGLSLHPDEHQMIFDSFIEYISKKAYYESKPNELAPFTTRTEEEINNDKQQAFSSLLRGLVK